MHIQYYTYKRHLIYINKHFATLHLNFKHQGQFQPTGQPTKCKKNIYCNKEISVMGKCII